jgi:hypothetical protein
MKNRIKSVFTQTNITSDTANIDSSGYNTIEFDNIGSDDVKLEIQSDPSLSYVKIPAGESKTFGGRNAGIILSQLFDVTFLGSVAPEMNIIKEKLYIIE